MKKTTKKTLVFLTETIRQLDLAMLRAAVGGTDLVAAPPPSQKYRCSTTNSGL